MEEIMNYPYLKCLIIDLSFGNKIIIQINLSIVLNIVLPILESLSYFRVNKIPK